MQYEWSRFSEGITNLKLNAGLLVFFCAAVLFAVCRKKSGSKVWAYSSVAWGVLLFFPVSALVLLKFYTPFYDWSDLFVLFPMEMVLGFGGAELWAYLQKKEIPGLRWNGIGKNIIAVCSVWVLLLFATNFHAFDAKTEADENGIPVKASEAFRALEQAVGEQELVLAAPDEVLAYTRLYNASWTPLYGRDLWSGRAASYINSGYTERDYRYYTILKEMVLPEEERGELTALVSEGAADCVILSLIHI